MNRLVRILLIVLAVLVIAGGGFWAGTGFAFRQAAVNPAPAINAVSGSFNTPSDFAPSRESRPGFNQQRDSNRPGNDTSTRDQAGDPRSSQAAPGFNNNQRAALPQGGQTGRMMLARPNTGFGGNNTMSFGGMFMGGGMILFGLLFPLGFAILMVLGIIVLFRMVRHPVNNLIAGSAVCAKCGAQVQNGWKYCPQCGDLIQ